LPEHDSPGGQSPQLTHPVQLSKTTPHCAPSELQSCCWQHTPPGLHDCPAPHAPQSIAPPQPS